MDVLEMIRGRDKGVEIKRKWKHILFSFLTKLFKNQSLFECVHKQYLQFLCTPAGSCLGDLLQLFDTFTEVWHPLDYSHGDGDCVPTPAAREDSWTDRCIPQVYKVFKQINKFIKVHQIVWVKNLWQGHWWVFAGSWSASSCPRTLVPRRTDPDGPPEASYLPFSLHAQRTWTGGPGIWTKIILMPKQNHKLEARQMCFGETEKEKLFIYWKSNFLKSVIPDYLTFQAQRLKITRRWNNSLVINERRILSAQACLPALYSLSLPWCSPLCVWED